MSAKTEFMKEANKYWSVTINYKSTGGWNGTSCLGVIAKSAQEAMQKVLDSNPDAKITAINHKGPIDL